MASNRPWLEINGVKSTTIAGLLITSVPPVAKPPRRYQLQTVDGLNGDIRTDLGYAAYDKTVGIGLAGSYDEDAIIAFFDQSGTVIFSNEPDKVYTFDGIEGFAMERLARMCQAEIILHVQPFKTSASETAKTLSGTTSVTNAGNRPSEPVLEITGTGTVGVSLDGTQLFSIAFPGTSTYIKIDTHEQEAYYSDGTFANRIVTGEYSAFRIPTGIHSIKLTGTVASAKIKGVSLWT